MGPDDFDPAPIFRQVVQPCLDSLVRPGELDALGLEWTTHRSLTPSSMVTTHESGHTTMRTDRVSAAAAGYPVAADLGPEEWLETTRLTLTLVLRGETFTQWLISANSELPDLDDLGERVYSDLQDFISESRFGWGQQR